MNRVTQMPLLLLLAVGLSACSAQSAYYTGQAWRRSLCDQTTGEERMHCLSGAFKTYGEYQRENAADK